MTITPGPWLVTKPRGAFNYEVVAQTEKRLMGVRLNSRICMMPHGPDSQNAARDNARLIAAAPELLAALWECANLLAELQAGGAENPELDIARAAIAKAEGETS